MRLLNIHTLQFEDFAGRSIPPYCILSHCWGDNEVSYKEYRKGLNRDGAGYRKIVEFCRRIRQREENHSVPDWGRCEWVWIDTCCIDKRSSAELSEAINSMFDWYRNAEKCYVYLSDVDEVPNRSRTEDELYSLLRHSRWFTRGWTLQELLAPKVVLFCDAHWNVFGHLTKQYTREGWGESITNELQKITGIPWSILKHEKAISQTSIAQRMSWASGRNTTRIEDEAYCLLGIFGINMPLLYGEGQKAFIRLQEEIIKHSTDQSILAWGGCQEISREILADSPRRFRMVDDTKERCHLSQSPFAITNNGLEMLATISTSGTTAVHVLRLNYSRAGGRAVSIPVRCIKAPNVYERASISEKHMSARTWKVLKPRLIYLRTGTEIVDRDYAADGVYDAFIDVSD